MSQKQPHKQGLSNGQLQTIVDVLCARHGQELPKCEFDDALLLLFEDIPGLELVSDSETQTMISELWSLYNEQGNQILSV